MLYQTKGSAERERELQYAGSGRERMQRSIRDSANTTSTYLSLQYHPLKALLNTHLPSFPLGRNALELVVLRHVDRYGIARGEVPPHHGQGHPGRRAVGPEAGLGSPDPLVRHAPVQERRKEKSRGGKIYGARRCGYGKRRQEC